MNQPKLLTDQLSWEAAAQDFTIEWQEAATPEQRQEAIKCFLKSPRGQKWMGMEAMNVAPLETWLEQMDQVQPDVVVEK